MLNDVIVALATAPMESAIGVIRVSGEDSFNLLEKILCYKRITCYDHETVEDIARKFPRDKILVRIESHLTCIVKGAILDIWDCSQELVDCFWFIY